MFSKRNNSTKQHLWILSQKLSDLCMHQKSGAELLGKVFGCGFFCLKILCFSCYKSYRYSVHVTMVSSFLVFYFNLAQMTTVVCDESKINSLLAQCDKCSKLKNIVKIGPPATDEEKAAAEKVGVKVICFKDLEVSQTTKRQVCLISKVLDDLVEVDLWDLYALRHT